MTIDTLLSRLDRVRQTGPGRWIARCPTRQDRSPSLAIRELDDGRVLIHDFGGASAEEVLGAVGLTLADLFPTKLNPDAKRERMPFSYADALRCVAFETFVVVTAAKHLARDERTPEIDRARLLVAAGRITAAMERCHGR